MREEKAPPTRKSTAAVVVCQSSDAAFHCLMLSGVVGVPNFLDGCCDGGLNSDFHGVTPGVVLRRGTDAARSGEPAARMVNPAGSGGEQYGASFLNDPLGIPGHLP